MGIQTYPSMETNAALNGLNDLVQAVFTLDCALKIIREGTRPWNYWLGPERSWNNFDFWLVVI